ncbi:substrate-binding domain-containing protein, partial [Streptomyces mirabilis]
LGDRPPLLVAHPGRVRLDTGGELLGRGVRDAQVPHDLSVVGYDDVPLAQWSSPALTTVHQPLREMAEEAAQMLMRLRSEEPVATRLELATSLVVRQSTAECRRLRD